MALPCQPRCLPSGDPCWLGDRVSSASSFSAPPPSLPVPTCMLLPSHLPPDELLHTHLTFPRMLKAPLVSPALTALLYIQLPSWCLPGGLQAPCSPRSQNPVSMTPTCTTASWVPASVNGMHTRCGQASIPGASPPFSLLGQSITMACQRHMRHVFQGGPPPGGHRPDHPLSYPAAYRLHKTARGDSPQIPPILPLLPAQGPTQMLLPLRSGKAPPLTQRVLKAPGHLLVQLPLQLFPSRHFSANHTECHPVPLSPFPLAFHLLLHSLPRPPPATAGYYLSVSFRALPMGPFLQSPLSHTRGPGGPTHSSFTAPVELCVLLWPLTGWSPLAPWRGGHVCLIHWCIPRA